jgi:hypothetical protein
MNAVTETTEAAQRGKHWTTNPRVCLFRNVCVRPPYAVRLPFVPDYFIDEPAQITLHYYAVSRGAFEAATQDDMTSAYSATDYRMQLGPCRHQNWCHQALVQPVLRAPLPADARYVEPRAGLLAALYGSPGHVLADELLAMMTLQLYFDLPLTFNNFVLFSTAFPAWVRNANQWVRAFTRTPMQLLPEVGRNRTLCFRELLVGSGSNIGYNTAAVPLVAPLLRTWLLRGFGLSPDEINQRPRTHAVALLRKTPENSSSGQRGIVHFEALLSALQGILAPRGIPVMPYDFANTSDKSAEARALSRISVFVSPGGSTGVYPALLLPVGCAVVELDVVVRGRSLPFGPDQLFPAVPYLHYVRHTVTAAEFRESDRAYTALQASRLADTISRAINLVQL